MEYYEYHGKVKYSDLGEDGFLTYTGAMGMMQEAASEDSARFGYGPADLKRNGVGWILVGWRMRMERRVPWGTALRVRTWARTMSIFFSDRDFAILDEAGETVLRATSRWILVDAATGRSARVTEQVAAAYPLWDHKAIEGDVAMNGRGPADAEETFRYTALRRDLDTFRHMNNLHYLELAREALPPEEADAFFPTVEILYKRQIRLGDQVRFFYGRDGERRVVELRDEAGKKPHAILWFS